MAANLRQRRDEGKRRINGAKNRRHRLPGALHAV
jgi:hypothetical protein